MSYNTPDPDDKIVTHNPLPSEVISILCSEEYIQTKLEEGVNPVVLSIEKWNNIIEVYTIISEKQHPYLYYPQIYTKIGYKTCALCIDSINRFLKDHEYMKYKEDKCTVCALAETDRCVDPESTYSKIDKILSREFEFGDDINEDDLLKEHKELKGHLEHFIALLKRLQQ